MSYIFATCVNINEIFYLVAILFMNICQIMIERFCSFCITVMCPELLYAIYFSCMVFEGRGSERRSYIPRLMIWGTSQNIAQMTIFIMYQVHLLHFKSYTYLQNLFQNVSDCKIHITPIPHLNKKVINIKYDTCIELYEMPK